MILYKQIWVWLLRMENAAGAITLEFDTIIEMMYKIYLFILIFYLIISLCTLELDFKLL